MYIGKIDMEKKVEHIDKKFGRGVEDWVEGMKEGTYE